MQIEDILRIGVGILGVALFVVFACADGKTAKSSTGAASAQKPIAPDPDGTDKVTKTDDEWKALLTSQQFHVLREKGTETAFTGAYWNEHRKGVYRCAECGKLLFSSDAKFDSGTG